MSTPIPVELIKTAICRLTSAVETSQGIEVSLPQVYNTGHSVTVVICNELDGMSVHDNSYASYLLSGAGVRVTSAVHAALAPLVAHYGCTLEGMRVSRSVSPSDDIGIAATLVGCASRLVADHALKVSPPPIFDFKSHLLGRVIEAVGESRIRTNEEVHGHLGSRYRISTVVLDSLQSRPIAFVEPIADREAVARRFKEFYDLKATLAYNGVDRVAVYDETNPLATGDALLMQEVGSLVRFADAPTMFSAWSVQ